LSYTRADADGLLFLVAASAKGNRRRDVKKTPGARPGVR